MKRTYDNISKKMDIIEDDDDDDSFSSDVSDDDSIYSKKIRKNINKMIANKINYESLEKEQQKQQQQQQNLSNKRPMVTTTKQTATNQPQFNKNALSNFSKTMNKNQSEKYFVQANFEKSFHISVPPETSSNITNVTNPRILSNIFEQSKMEENKIYIMIFGHDKYPTCQEFMTYFENHIKRNVQFIRRNPHLYYVFINVTNLEMFKDYVQNMQITKFPTIIFVKKCSIMGSIRGLDLNMFESYLRSVINK